MLKVEAIECAQNFQLRARLSNGAEGFFDVKPYLSYGIFSELNNIEYFRAVKINFAGIYWPNGQDFSADTLEHELKPNP